MHRRFRYLPERKSRFPRILFACLPILFGLSLFSQAVFATTYVITDGPRVYTCTAYRTDPASVLLAAGLELDEHDSYTAADTSITIRRAQTIQVSYHGKSFSVTSTGETVGHLLDRLGLIIGESDVLSHPRAAKTYDGMSLRIDRVVQQRQTYTRVLPKTVLRCNSDALPLGTEEILIPGRDGELLCTADVTYVNGVESRRDVIREEVVRGAFQSIVASGTGSSATGISRGVPVVEGNTITLPNGQVLTFTHTGTVRATAYTHTDAGCNMLTATESTVHVGTVAVDPRFIPYGTRMFIMASDGSYIYGISEAEDCGGDIVGDRVDLYLPTFQDCMEFGRRDCTVYFLG